MESEHEMGIVTSDENVSPDHNSNNSKKIIISVGIILGFIFVLFTMTYLPFFIASQRDTNQASTERRPQPTESEKTWLSDFIQGDVINVTMLDNLTANPCENFYNHACSLEMGSLPFPSGSDLRELFFSRLTAETRKIDVVNASKARKFWKTYVDSCYEFWKKPLKERLLFIDVAVNILGLNFIKDYRLAPELIRTFYSGELENGVGNDFMRYFDFPDWFDANNRLELDCDKGVWPKMLPLCEDVMEQLRRRAGARSNEHDLNSFSDEFLDIISDPRSASEDNKVFYEVLYYVAEREIYTRFSDPQEKSYEDCVNSASNIWDDTASTIYVDSFKAAEKNAFNVLISNILLESSFSKKSFQLECLQKPVKKYMLSLFPRYYGVFNEVLEAEDLLQSFSINDAPHGNTFYDEVNLGHNYVLNYIRGILRKNEVRTGLISHFNLKNLKLFDSTLWWLNTEMVEATTTKFMENLAVTVVPLIYLGAYASDDVPKNAFKLKMGFELIKETHSLIDFKCNAFLGKTMPVDAIEFYKSLMLHYKHVMPFQANDENFASEFLTDDLALRSTFSAAFPLKANTSKIHKQYFFYSLARQMCHSSKRFVPAENRVNHAFRGFSEFNDAFGCTRMDGDETPVLCLGKI